MGDANSFGKYFRWTTFGESHGVALGVVIDGCPAGVIVSADLLAENLKRRRPGQNDASGEVLVSARNEEDEVQIVSGIYSGKTLGTPIACLIYNKDQRSQDYEDIKKQPRIGHADDVWQKKFSHADHRGGGRSSARETVARVVAGSFAQMFLQSLYPDLRVLSFVNRIGPIELSEEERSHVLDQPIDAYIARFPTQKSQDVLALLKSAKETGDSYGGSIETWVDGVPVGWGEPVFDKLKARLAYAMMGIGATCGFEIGAGNALIDKKGSDIHTDATSSIYGGIRGGISTGERVHFCVSFKPTSTIKEEALKGRHDPCVLPRAVSVVEAMTWATLADMALAARLSRALDR